MGWIMTSENCWQLHESNATTTQSIFNDIISIYDKAPTLKEGTLYEFFSDYIRDYYDVTLKQCDEICKMLKVYYKAEKFYAND